MNEQPGPRQSRAPAACCLPAGGEPEPRREHPWAGNPRGAGRAAQGAPGTPLQPVPLRERGVRTPFRRLRSRPRREGTWLMGGVERAADCLGIMCKCCIISFYLKGNLF